MTSDLKLVWRSTEVKHKSFWEKIGMEWDCQQMHYHHCWLEIYHHHQACACWQCAIIMSVFCHWIGISAEWPTTIGSWEHLLMCQRGVHYAWHKKLSSVVFWEPPIVRLEHCSSSLKHYESMPFHTNENQLTIGGGLQLEKEVSGKSACMHQNEKQAYHEIPRKTASLFHGCCRPNQPRFQNMFSFLFCMFCSA